MNISPQLSMLTRQPRLMSVLAASLSLSLSLSFGLGDLKNWPQINWLDVVGEGSIAFILLLWILVILASRPPGKVTTALTLGLVSLLFSALLDWFDEFVHYDAAAAWLSVIESMPAALGMLIMSYALYQWHLEQLALNRQLSRRERGVRQHDQIDYITQLYRLDYMRGQIDQQLQNGHRPLTLVMLDINDFDQFNRHFGHSEGDRLLREIAELILMNLRQTDLACRYAGDRFILLLPDTDQQSAEELSQQIRTTIRHLAYKPATQPQPVYPNVSFCAAMARPGDKVEALLRRVSLGLEHAKYAV